MPFHLGLEGIKVISLIVGSILSTSIYFRLFSSQTGVGFPETYSPRVYNINENTLLADHTSAPQIPVTTSCQPSSPQALPANSQIWSSACAKSPLHVLENFVENGQPPAAQSAEEQACSAPKSGDLIVRSVPKEQKIPTGQFPWKWGVCFTVVFLVWCVCWLSALDHTPCTPTDQHSTYDVIDHHSTCDVADPMLDDSQEECLGCALLLAEVAELLEEKSQIATKHADNEIANLQLIKIADLILEVEDKDEQLADLQKTVERHRENEYVSSQVQLFQNEVVQRLQKRASKQSSEIICLEKTLKATSELLDSLETDKINELESRHESESSQLRMKAQQGEQEQEALWAALADAKKEIAELKLQVTKLEADNQEATSKLEVAQKAVSSQKKVRFASTHTERAFSGSTTDVEDMEKCLPVHDSTMDVENMSVTSRRARKASSPAMPPTAVESQQASRGGAAHQLSASEPPDGVGEDPCSMATTTNAATDASGEPSPKIKIGAKSNVVRPEPYNKHGHELATSKRRRQLTIEILGTMDDSPLKGKSVRNDHAFDQMTMESPVSVESDMMDSVTVSSEVTGSEPNTAETTVTAPDTTEPDTIMPIDSPTDTDPVLSLLADIPAETTEPAMADADAHMAGAEGGIEPLSWNFKKAETRCKGRSGSGMGRSERKLRRGRGPNIHYTNNERTY